MRHGVATVDAVGAVVAQHVDVSRGHPNLRHVGEAAVRQCDVQVRLLHHHAVDDGAAALDGDTVALHGDDALDVVEVRLLRVQVDRNVATARARLR